MALSYKIGTAFGKGNAGTYRPAGGPPQRWTEGRIPRKDFAAQGVNLAQIDAIALGVGTKGNTTTAGGS